jgi:hypothetical protein
MFCFYIKWKGRVWIPRENSLQCGKWIPLLPGNKNFIVLILNTFFVGRILCKFELSNASQDKSKSIYWQPLLLLHAVYFILARFHNVPPFPYRDEKTRAKKPLAKLADKRMNCNFLFSLSRVCDTNEHLPRLSWYIMVVLTMCEHLFSYWLPFFWLDKEIDMCK